MKQSNVHYWTGIFGIVMFALGMTVLPLYFIYSGAPPVWNIPVAGGLFLAWILTVSIYFVCNKENHK
jgi:hypothetical protein